jgi:hypothetical protein
MSFPWKEDQLYLLNAIDKYREIIKGKEIKEARRLTKEFADTLHKRTKDLHHRSPQSINERMPYFDNLLAGALEKENYAIKDRHLYETNQRPDGNKDFNECNKRHGYNGYLR